jgi:hypothetical protein
MRIAYRISYIKDGQRDETAWMESPESVLNVIKSFQRSRRITDIKIYQRTVKNVTNQFTKGEIL